MTEVSDRVEETGAAFFADPHAAYRQWRARAGAQRVRFRDGTTAWVVSGYQECRATLSDPRLAKSVAGAMDALRSHGNDAPVASAGMGEHMLNSDPPDHTRLRKLVTQAFMPRAVERLRPRIEQITDELLDAMAGRDEVDLMAAFALPLPVTVLSETLGIPREQQPVFHGLTSAVVAALGEPTGLAPAARSMMTFLAALVQAKRDDPADDLLSRLIAARDDDDRLSEQELVSTAFLLLVAGHQTMVNLIGNGVYALLDNPEQLAALRADLSRVPAAIDELLRYEGPVNLTTMRYATEPLQIGDTAVAEGDLVYVALTGANRDPQRFPDPDRLDLGRTTTGHLAFGHGIHHCLGALLARLEATVAFTRLLERFPHLRLAPDAEPPAYLDTGRLRSLLRLPVRLT